MRSGEGSSHGDAPEASEPWAGWPVGTKKRLWVTLGNSPQPAVLAALALQPDEIVPIVTAQSQGVADIAKRFLESIPEVPQANWRDALVVPVDDPQAIRKALQRPDLGPAHLVYNGGSAAMAATASEALLGSEGRESCRLWNVADRSGVIRSSDGRSVPIPQVSADLGSHLALAKRAGAPMTLGNVRQSVRIEGGGAPPDPDPFPFDRAEDLETVANAVADVLAGGNFARFGAFLTRYGDPANGYPELCGKALEWGVFALIARGLRAAYSARRAFVPAHVYLGANIQRGPETVIELDVVVVHGPRLTVLSCGADTNRIPLTLKYSEAIQRAEVVGGGEARSITVVQRTGKKHRKDWDKMTSRANDHRAAAITDTHPQADRHRLLYLAELFGVDPTSRTLVADVTQALLDPLGTRTTFRSLDQLPTGRRDASLFSGLLYPDSPDRPAA